MDFYCEHEGCQQFFRATLKSGMEHHLPQIGRQQGFHPFVYPGEYIYHIHWFCDEHKKLGEERKAEKQTIFDENEKLQEENQNANSVSEDSTESSS